MAERGDERVWFLGALVAVTFAFQQQALKLQRGETDRRLKELNNEAARLKQAVAANVSSDTWAAFVGTYKEDGDRNQRRFERISQFQNKLLGAVAFAVVFVPLLVALIVYLLTRHAIPSTR